MARFEDVAREFWARRIAHEAPPPLTTELVTAAENVLGAKLPAELLALLRLQNGGVVSSSYNRCPAASNYYSDDHVPFLFLDGIVPAGGGSSLLDTPYLVREWDLPTPIVLLYGEGHFWVALDYRDSGTDGEPSVTWIDNEMEHELPLAPTFRSFIEKLTSAPERDALDVDQGGQRGDARTERSPSLGMAPWS